jgi:hypothetical protein
MAIDFRIGTKINKSLRTDLAPATNISPFPYIGVVKNNLDPTRCGRVQVFIPELGGNPDDPANWRTISYASPFMGYTSTEINQTDAQDNKESFTNVTHTYGMWMVPPDIGVEVICMFIAGDPMRGYWVACVNSNLSRYMLPGLASSTNVNSTFATANAKASYTPGDQLPVVEFNENIPANETNSNFYNAPKPIHETQYAVLKQQGLNSDTTRGTITSSSQRETPSQVFGISTPGRPTNDPADDPNYVRKLNAGTLTENYYRVKSRKGGHTFVMDDGSVLGVDQLVRLRTAGGHQILMHDTEETIYVGHAKGNSWIELSKTGSINIYSHGGVNLRSEGDINFHSDGNINLNADKNINLHAAKISNVAATYSLPDTLFNSNTGTWYSADNQIHSITTVAPTHEPFNRNTVANTSELSSSIFVDTNQLIQANVGMRGYVDAIAVGTTNYSNANVKSYLTQFDGSIIPSANVTYDLGDNTHRWRDLYLSGTTITLGDSTISAEGGKLVTIDGSLTVGGNLFVNGNLTTVSANNLSINDSIIFLAENNPADSLDIGFVSAFTDAVRYQRTGLVRDASDGTWKLFANVVAEPTTTVDFTNATYSNLQVGTVSASTGAFGTVTTSGNVLVGGSIVVYGNLVAAGSSGTSGQVLQSNGNSSPSWNSLASFTEFDKSLTIDGYQKLPGGLIMQWGTTGVIAGPGTAAITFPIAFTTSCFNVQITIKDVSGDTSSTGIVAARSVTTTGFILRNGDDPDMIFNWLAIGY